MKCKVCEKDAEPLVVHLVDGDVQFDFCAEHGSTLLESLDIPRVLIGAPTLQLADPEWLVNRPVTGESWRFGSTDEYAAAFLRRKVLDTDLVFHPWAKRWVPASQVPAVTRELEIATGRRKPPSRFVAFIVLLVLAVIVLFGIVRLVHYFWYL